MYVCVCVYVCMYICKGMYDMNVFIIQTVIASKLTPKGWESSVTAVLTSLFPHFFCVFLVSFFSLFPSCFAYTCLWCLYSSALSSSFFPVPFLPMVHFTFHLIILFSSPSLLIPYSFPISINYMQSPSTHVVLSFTHIWLVSTQSHRAQFSPTFLISH